MNKRIFPVLAVITTVVAFENDIQYIRTEIDDGYYPPITVRQGIPVEWTVVVPEGKLNGCNGEILIPAYDIDVKLQEGENRISFLPNKVEVVPYSCWMGMIKSSIDVVD